MRRIFFILVIVFISSSFVDRPLTEKEFNYFEMSPEEFFASDVANEPINLFAPDNGLASVSVFHATNLLRKKRGYKTLRPNYNLHLAGLAHIEAMQKHNFFGHYNRYDRRNRTISQRVRNSGGRFYVVAENLARVHPFKLKGEEYKYRYRYGKYYYYDRHDQPLKPMTYGELGKSIVTDWYHSPGHRENLFDKDLTHLGVAVVIAETLHKSSELPHVYAAQEFGG